MQTAQFLKKSKTNNSTEIFLMTLIKNSKQPVFNYWIRKNSKMRSSFMPYLEKIKKTTSNFLYFLYEIIKTKRDSTKLNIDSEIQTNVEVTEMRGSLWIYFKF